MTSRRFLLWLVLMVAVFHMPQLVSAQVVVDIGGSPPQNPGPDPNSVNIAGNYGTCQGGGAAITITNLSGNTARVYVSNDSTIDYLALANALITANCAVTNFRIAFGFNNASLPSTPPVIGYQYQLKGYLMRSVGVPPPGGQVKAKASYMNSPPTPASTAFNTAIGSETSTSSYIVSLTDASLNLTVSDPRGLEGEFTFTLPAQNDVLKVTSYPVKNIPGSGGGGDSCDECPCETCPTFSTICLLLIAVLTLLLLLCWFRRWFWKQ